MTVNSGWYARLRANPKNFGYSQVMRLLDGNRNIRIQIKAQKIGYNGQWDLFDVYDNNLRDIVLITNRCSLIGTGSILPHYINDASKHAYYDLDDYSLDSFFQIFNERYLRLDYRVEICRYLPLYFERIWLSNTKPPKHFLDFSGLLTNTSHWMLSYSLRCQIKTRALEGVASHLSKLINHPITVEQQDLSRWPITLERIWHLNNKFKLGKNIMIGSFSWIKGQIIRVIIHVSSADEWIEISKTTLLHTRIEFLSRALLPHRYINYYVELLQTSTEPPKLSCQQKGYRLSYFNSDTTRAPRGYVRIALQTTSKDS
ncbi:type VI secretion system baseplate subunit TssG [Sansalvadorimonas sp. 2012CJ34-2]|uniref:Type VI secretion system baseplate subunit TssG n=1 Tax=Parendozoicomonas callyspongiae TaxID=2942213 RepID=A0ABT0PBR7_9GAMM|nr:type VI secretion system baseplate subunit TssG [Sansalvadorimonas sp. 2012CJ34-2]MCL6268830.1 type VI secretion system baseplate subunit TssG [Sansalvadorimonas sp. 2012CJ34-2]